MGEDRVVVVVLVVGGGDFFDVDGGEVTSFRAELSSPPVLFLGFGLGFGFGFGFG